MNASKDRMDWVMNSLNFSFNFTIDAKGVARGLSLMWNAGTMVNPVDFNKYWIVVNISDATCDWNLVGFYDPPYAAKKKKA